MAYWDQGLSMEEISVKIGRSKCAICHLLKDPENYGTKKSSGRSKSLDPRDRSLVFAAGQDATPKFYTNSSEN